MGNHQWATRKNVRKVETVFGLHYLEKLPLQSVPEPGRGALDQCLWVRDFGSEALEDVLLNKAQLAGFLDIFLFELVAHLQISFFKSCFAIVRFIDVTRLLKLWSDIPLMILTCRSWQRWQPLVELPTWCLLLDGLLAEMLWRGRVFNPKLPMIQWPMRSLWSESVSYAKHEVPSHTSIWHGVWLIGDCGSHWNGDVEAQWSE